MTLNLFIVALLGLLAALLAYVSIFTNKGWKSRVWIILLLLLQLGLTVYKGYIDENLKDSLNDKGIVLQWQQGQLVPIYVRDSSVVVQRDTVAGALTLKDSFVTKTDTIHLPVAIPDQDMPASECLTYGINLDYCYGRYYIKNNFREKLLLYKIYNGAITLNCSVLISPGESGLTPLLRSGPHDNNGNCTVGSEEYKFYFRTVYETTEKFGSISLSTQACKIRTTIIGENNMYLANDGERGDR